LGARAGCCRLRFASAFFVRRKASQKRAKPFASLARQFGWLFGEKFAVSFAQNILSRKLNRGVAPAIEVKSPLPYFALCLMGEEATKGSHRSPTNIAKDKQAWNGKPAYRQAGAPGRPNY